MTMKAEMILSLVLLAVPAAARPRVARSLPGADALILKALAGPATGYTALERIQVFRPAGKPKAQTVAVFARPGGLVRREYRFGRSKEPGLVSVRDGRRSRLLWPARKRLWSGGESEETPEQGLARLRALYELSVSTGGRVAKRATWRVDLRVPGGRVRRSLWLDRRSGLLLKRETYRPDGALSRRERFTKLELPADPAESLFRLEAPADERPADSLPPLLPRWTPDGFLLIDVHSPSGGSGKDIDAAYSDGASRVALRQVPASEQPKLQGKNLRIVKLGSKEFVVSETDEGSGLLHRAGDRVTLLSGDLPEDELVRMAGSLEAQP